MNDSFEITIQIKWLIQLIFFVSVIIGSYYTLQSGVSDNFKEIEQIKESLIEYEKQVDERIEPLEAERERRLAEMDKSLMTRILGKDG